MQEIVWGECGGRGKVCWGVGEVPVVVRKDVGGGVRECMG